MPRDRQPLVGAGPDGRGLERFEGERLAAVRTFRATPIYEATARIMIESDNPTVVSGPLNQLLHTIALFQQLLVRDVHALTAEVIDRETLHDLVVAVAARHRVPVDHARGDA